MWKIIWKIVNKWPFIDDFSYDFPQVNPDLWDQSSVFVNRTYPINPPTIGVATFDGMNEKGLARDFYPSTSSEPSDTLLSKEIDISGVDSAESTPEISISFDNKVSEGSDEVEG